MAEKEYIVSLKKGVDCEAFCDEMSTTFGLGTIPARVVDIVDARPGSMRNTHYSLTNDEAEKLATDPRVHSVEIPPDQRDDIEIGPAAVQNGTWDKNVSISSSDLNWGMVRGSNGPDLWGSGNNIITADYPYTLVGKGVDVVIQDSGLSVSHPEFTNADGVSRVVELDWYNASGLSGTMNANHYRDNHGHGSHCAGTVAGRTMGWAKDAAIYSVKVRGLEGSGDGGTGISITDVFDVIKLWHRNKPIDPITGFKRPTVVNMSWGYSGSRSSLLSGIYRETPWTYGDSGFSTSNEVWANAGIIPFLGSSRKINVRVGSVDTDLEELIDEGVHVCIAAGNSYYYISADGEQDYNNSANFGSGESFYHRGASPYSADAFSVGNQDTTYENGIEHKAESSCSGSGVDIYAPGTYITSVASTDKNGGCDLTDGTEANVSTADSPLDSAYKIMKISGTSMASPNVAGMIATILEANPGMTPAQMKTFIHNNATSGILYDGPTDSWSDQKSIQGGHNRIFKTPFVNPVKVSYGGGVIID